MVEDNEGQAPTRESLEPEHGERFDPSAPARRTHRRPGGWVVVGGVAVGALVIGGTGLGLALSAGASTTGPAPAGCASSTPHLTVQGTGQAEGTPDLLTAVFGFT